MLKQLSAAVAAIAALAALPALAHEGHGMPGPSHWHATDVLLVLAVVAMAAGLWWARCK